MTIRPFSRALAAALLFLGACGSSTDEQALDGAVATPPLVVADQQLPQAGTGEPFAFRAEPGQLLAVYFGYTQCPDLCPTTMADLKVALGELTAADAARVTVVLVTVDPDRDTPEILDAYLGSFFDADHRVALRTTDTDALARTEDAFLADSTVIRTGNGVEVEHTATTSVVDDQGTVVVQWPFGTSATSMAHDLRILLTRGKVATSSG